MPFKPGQSGNPGGRPTGLAAHIRQQTGLHGERLFELIRQIAEGDVAVTPMQQKAIERVMGRDPEQARELLLLITKLNMPSLKERLDAIRVLVEHGHGKPKEQINVTNETGQVEISAMDVSRLTLAERIAWRDLVRKAGARSGDDAEWVEVVPQEPVVPSEETVNAIVKVKP